MPTELTIWDWLFDSQFSPLCRGIPDSELGGYQNAITKDRISWRDVKENTTWLSTALVKEYGLEKNQTVALFSENTIWYPVAMLGTLRAGIHKQVPGCWLTCAHKSVDRWSRIRCFASIQCGGDDLRLEDRKGEILDDSAIIGAGCGRSSQERWHSQGADFPVGRSIPWLYYDK